MHAKILEIQPVGLAVTGGSGSNPLAIRLIRQVTYQNKHEVYSRMEYGKGVIYPTGKQGTALVPLMQAIKPLYDRLLDECWVMEDESKQKNRVKEPRVWEVWTITELGTLVMKGKKKAHTFKDACHAVFTRRLVSDHFNPKKMTFRRKPIFRSETAARKFAWAEEDRKRKQQEKITGRLRQ